jgi:mannobiose 2-epimerase
MTIEQLKNEVAEELTGNILPYWITNMVDNEYGGFLGHIDFFGRAKAKANKGGILNARILWTFSASYQTFAKEEYLHMSHRAFQYICENFLDPTHGGTFWELDYLGNPVNTKKQIYALAFTIYAFSEYYKLTGNNFALEAAKGLFQDIELHAFDVRKNGYFEAFTENWNVIEDLRLSEKDQNESKTMNTHLHILEAYTNLYRVWQDDLLRNQLRNLIELFIERFINSRGHLNLFFDDDWNLKSDLVSFGHDIECSWLLQEAAEVLGDDDLIIKSRSLAGILAKENTKGLDKDGGLFYDFFPSEKRWDKDKHWWPQAEALVGYFNAYKNTGDEEFLKIAFRCWQFIKKYIVDKKNGEWHWSVNKEGQARESEEKAGFWKCPYHNSRACLEIISR